MQPSFETYLPWFILREIPFLGNRMYNKLIRRFKRPEAILTASGAHLKTVDKISKRVIDGIKKHKAFEGKAKKELELVLKQNIKIVTLTDPSYPALLKQIQDPPPFLTYFGNLDNVSPCLAMVGSRNATSYGLNTAETLSARLTRKGFQIVSGLARGIDTAAHQGALKAKGKTIAVLGSGLNRIYPKENIALFQTIARQGTVFSEFRINTDPFPSNFPIRNRIIAGLSCGSIIVEAAKRSGSLITARLSGEYNREVFAVPGSIKSKKSEGTHSLLKQGATLVENEMDIIDELHHFIHEKKEASRHPAKKNITPAPLQNEKPSHFIKKEDRDMQEIIPYLDAYPVHIDVLIEKSGIASSQVTSQLLDLELAGIVVRHQGNYYSISEDYH